MDRNKLWNQRIKPKLQGYSGYECSRALYRSWQRFQGPKTRTFSNQLAEHKGAIENAFGGPLRWEGLEGKRACRISYVQPGGGYRSPEEAWPTVQGGIVHAMDKLEKALRPFIKELVLP